MKRIAIVFAASIVAGLGLLGCATEARGYPNEYPYYYHDDPDALILSPGHHRLFEERRLHAMRESRHPLHEHGFHEGPGSYEKYAMRGFLRPFDPNFP